MSDITDMQNTLLKMMGFFHGYCVTNNLRYFIVEGTALGAIRHKGFIPWDDDIDIGMPRNDYEKLIRLMSSYDNDRYEFESVHSTDENYCYSYSKLYDTSTTLIENIRNPLKRGVYIDIFPLDGGGNTEKEVRRNCIKIITLKKILELRKTPIDKQRRFYKNCILGFVQWIPESIINEKKTCMEINKLSKRKEFDKCELVGNLSGAWGWKEIMPRQLFGNPTLYQFESIMVYGPEDYDGYLTHLYGDWRKLPPKEKRVSHHDYYLDLNKSYLD